MLWKIISICEKHDCYECPFFKEEQCYFGFAPEFWEIEEIKAILADAKEGENSGK